MADRGNVATTGGTAGTTGRRTVLRAVLRPFALDCRDREAALFFAVDVAALFLAVDVAALFFAAAAAAFFFAADDTVAFLVVLRRVCPSTGSAVTAASRTTAKILNLRYSIESGLSVRANRTDCQSCQ